MYPGYQDNARLAFWNERLNYEAAKPSWGSKTELVIVIVFALLAGLIVSIPNITGIDQEKFLFRNISFIVFPLLSAYFIWKQKLAFKQYLFPLMAFIIAAIYINLLPTNKESNSVMLAFIHLPIFLWTMFGYSFLGENIKSSQSRISFLRYNGDLLVISGILLLATILFSAITVNLFDLIGINIEIFYFQNIMIWGIAAIPIVATHLIQTNAQLINKVSPIIAKIFTPLVFINLFIYLSAIVYTKKYPYQDRNVLLLFNVLLMGVMALILFSITEAGKAAKNKFSLMILFGLSALTIIVNGIALSAIVYRINEFGFSANRIAVLGGNLLIFINLALVSYKLFLTSFKNGSIEEIEQTIAGYLPVYAIWTGLVAFLMPLLFQFK
ncbi:MAG: hypothetical protein EXR19_05905 [Chitinophagaceae bacterium]|nr:hypothetical protein [Chitinophagaceae bacterium]